MSRMKRLAWFIFPILIPAAVLVACIYILAVTPDPPKPVVVKICGNIPIFQRSDGTVFIRHRLNNYRVADLDKLC
jgi:hypothetical protein